MSVFYFPVLCFCPTFDMLFSICLKVQEMNIKQLLQFLWGMSMFSAILNRLLALKF